MDKIAVLVSMAAKLSTMKTIEAVLNKTANYLIRCNKVVTDYAGVIEYVKRARAKGMADFNIARNVELLTGTKNVSLLVLLRSDFDVSPDAYLVECHTVQINDAIRA